MDTLPVPIQRDGTLLGPDKTKRLSRGRRDEVRWIAILNGGPWTVSFTNGSPFASATFQVSAGNPAESGPPVGEIGRGFKYDILDQNGNITEDPEIIIDA